MRRPFSILAASAALLVVLGLAGGVGPLVASMAALGVHATALAALAASSRRVDATAARLALPGWVGAQAEKNRRKALAYALPGSALAVAGWWLARSGWSNSVASGAGASFQVGSFLGESLIVANQSKLLADLASRVELAQ